MDDTYPQWPNLAAMMFGLARGWPGRPMLRHWRDEAWHGVSWGEFARRAASAARGLRALGVSAGDRVLIVSENRPEVPIAETALMAIRAVPVLGYPTNTPEDHAHLLRDSGARFVIEPGIRFRGEVGEQATLFLYDPSGNARVLVLGWGGTFGAISAAVRLVRKEGRSVAQAHLRHLNPFPANLPEVLRSYDKVIVPEINLGQLALLLRGRFLVDVISYNQVRGLPFKAEELQGVIQDVIDSE